MKKPGVKFLNTILAFGMLFLFAGFLLTISFLNTGKTLAISVYPLIVSLAGLAFLYIYIAFSHTAFKLFVGLELILNGLFFVFVTQKICPLTLGQCWPIVVIFTGISYFSAGKSKYRKWVFIFDFPGILLVLFGAFFLLFSLNVIKISFTKIAVFAIPALFIISGILLIVLFFKRKSLLEILPDSLSEEFSDSKVLDENQNLDNSDGEE